MNRKGDAQVAKTSKGSSHVPASSSTAGASTTAGTADKDEDRGEGGRKPSWLQKGADKEEDRGDEELAPEGEEEEEEDRDGDDLDAIPEDEWEEFYANPLNVRFTQEKIHPFFYRRGPIVNVVPRIRAVMCAQIGGDDIVELVPPFGPIHCLKKGDEMWSMDNRRLYALQLSAMEQWPTVCRVRLLCRDRLPRHKFKTQYRKFSTTNEGQSVDVCARYQQFDTWSWMERALELELYTFSQRLGTLFSAFEVLPVLGALLFRTGLTGFETRVPLVVGFVLTFSLDFLRQKVPVIERKICGLHVRAVMDGDVKQLSSCCRRFRLTSEDDCMTTSAPQLAAMMALALLLFLPYIMGITHEKARSSLISCWLGVGCVLVVQLLNCFRESQESADSSISSPLTPKHRE